MEGDLYRLLPAADADMEDIFAHGLERYGWSRAADYAINMGKVFRLLADNPALGASRDAIAPGLRVFRSDSHVIFYRETPHEEICTIVVVRVLGGSMDHGRHLN